MADTNGTAATRWTDHYWWSADTVRLHARLYGAPDAATVPILCLPGLTRNARDFDALAPALAQQGGQVAAVNFRGRGESGYSKNPMSYVPLIYAQDVAALLDSLGWQRCAIIGTSLGGLVAMLLAASLPGRIAGAVLNDVGPELETAGLARIRTYVGGLSSQPTWLHAARQAAETNASVFPDHDIQDWLRMVHRTHRLTPEGRIVADYDKQIAVPLRAPDTDAAADMWPVFDALAASPLLVVRGELSDILAASSAQKMVARASNAALCTVPRVGHAPTLDEPEARTAIAAWRARLIP